MFLDKKILELGHSIAYGSVTLKSLQNENIPEIELDRIWKRFYKVDSSRKREDGGTGIGLALVKAIMNNYENDFGVENKDNGVEFYFELDK